MTARKLTQVRRIHVKSFDEAEALCQTASGSARQQSVVTVGNFDGVHIGHQALLKKLVSEANERSARSVVVSFYPHPAVVLTGSTHRKGALTPLREKIKLLSEIGVDLLLLVHFTKEFSSLSAEEFLTALTLNPLLMTHMVLGPDTAFGRGREGNVAFITNWMAQSGFTTETMEPVLFENERVSTTRVRQLIEEGAVCEVQKLLGRPFSIFSRIKAGDGRGGSQLGYPTANMLFAGYVIPADGVYATNALVNGKVYEAVTNVGLRPTVDGHSRQIETHLIGQSLDLYGKVLEVEFLKRLREEMKFDSLESLKAQIGRDVEQAEKMFQEQRD